MEPWGEAHGRSGFQASVGRWHRRALPTRKPLWGRGAECLLQPIALQGTPKGCAPSPGKVWGSHGWEEMLCSCWWCFPIWVCAHRLPLPLLSARRPEAFAASRGLLMCELDPLLEERLQRWGSAKQPCDPPLHGEHRPVGLLFLVSYWKAVQISADFEARNAR